MKRGAALAATVAALGAVAVSTAGPTSTAPIFGTVGERILYQQLVPYDPLTLRPLAGRVALAGHRSGWSFSPDGRQLVLGKSANPCRDADLRFVDTAQPALLGDVRLPQGPVQATAWPDAGHVLVVLGPVPPTCAGPRQTRVVLLEASARRVLATRWLRGSAIRLAVVDGGAVVLLGPTGRPGAATLAVVDRTGNVRTKLLEAIPAGETSRPGLAIDAGGERAFVVSGDDGVTEVELPTLRVDFHPLVERTLAKGIDAAVRQVVWLGNGRLAVTGTDSAAPMGLRLVDTRAWSFRTIDPEASQVQRAGGVLLAQGAGLRVYTLSGRERYRLFDGESVAAFAAGDRLYATVRAGHRMSRTYVLDLATGRVAGTASTPVWNLLVGNAAPLSG